MGGAVRSDESFSAGSQAYAGGFWAAPRARGDARALPAAPWTASASDPWRGVYRGGVAPAAFTVRQVASDSVSDSLAAPAPDTAVAPPAPLPPGASAPVPSPGEGPVTMSEGDFAEYGWGQYGTPYSYVPGQVVGSPRGWQGSCPRVLYTSADAMYMDRRSTRYLTLSEAFFLPDFDRELSGRATVGQRFDCSDGWEASYVGPLEFETGVAVTAPGLTPIFVAYGIDISAFMDGQYQALYYDSRLHSFELGKKTWAWDVMSQSLGVRYLYLEEDFLFESVNNVAEAGSFRTETTNHIVGLQYGIDLLYPYGPRWVFGGKAKLGAYGNFIDGKSRLVNAGVIQFDNESDKGQFAALGEFGIYADYKILPRVTARAGYELWWLYGVALAGEQEHYVLTRYAGRSLNSDGDILYQALTAGVEIVW